MNNHAYMLFITFYFPRNQCKIEVQQHMALLISIIIIFFLLSIFPSTNNAQGPPSPGYYPSSIIGSIGFNQGFANLWGRQHQLLDHDSLTIWLDQTSGT